MYLNIFVAGVVSHHHSHLQAFYRSRHQSHISIRGHMETCYVLMQTARPLAKVLGDKEASLKSRGWQALQCSWQGMKGVGSQ